MLEVSPGLVVVRAHRERVPCVRAWNFFILKYLAKVETQLDAEITSRKERQHVDRRDRQLHQGKWQGCSDKSGK